MDKSTAFYQEILRLHIIIDFSANKTLASWQTFIGKSDIAFGGNNAETYFEEDNFAEFIQRLETLDLDYVHSVQEHSWEQRVVRFYDPDKHIIEVGENMQTVCRRFLASGITPEQTAERMDVPLAFVTDCTN